MKLRIKYLDKRLTVDINENEDVATLMVKCQDIAPPGYILFYILSLLSKIRI